MTTTAIRPPAKGWCPGAYRPMESGDGLIVRVRPVLARLTAEQAYGLCEAARACGSGIIDLTSRANLQIRGVRPDTHGPLLERLGGLGLLDADPALESRRNILVDPYWQAGDDTARVAAALTARLGDLPPLPAKFGFAVDAGTGRRLAAASADIRVERGTGGGLILRADGAPLGRPVAVEDAVDAVIALAHWFIASGGAAAGRMAFSNYLMTSIITSLVFCGYGFGLYGELSRAEQLWVVAGVWAFILTWSQPWLTRFQYGPFEWVWRSLVQWKRQPFVKHPRPVGA